MADNREEKIRERVNELQQLMIAHKPISRAEINRLTKYYRSGGLISADLENRIARCIPLWEGYGNIIEDQDDEQV